MRLNSLRVVLAAAVLLPAAALPAAANEYGEYGAGHAVYYNARHDPMRAIDREQQRQQERIVHGVRTGQLTRHEARNLMREQHAIDAEQRRYLADGRLTRAELADLRRDLSQSARRIERERHDWDRR